MNKDSCPSCGNLKTAMSLRCRSCNNRSVDRTDVEEKACTECKNILPIAEFGLVNRYGGVPRRQAKCKECIRTHSRNRYNTQEHVRKRKSERYLEVSPEEKVIRSLKASAYSLKLNAKEIVALWKASDKTCAICEKECLGSSGGKRLCVDHDHETGKFRGFLCLGCNTAIGHLGDDPVRIRAAADYVERHKIQ